MSLLLNPTFTGKMCQDFNAKDLVNQVLSISNYEDSIYVLFKPPYTNNMVLFYHQNQYKHTHTRWWFMRTLHRHNVFYTVKKTLIIWP